MELAIEDETIRLPRRASSRDPGSPLVPTLHLINAEHYAGAERVQDRLALQLPAYGFEVAFACLKPDRFPALREAQQAELYSLPMRCRFDLRPALAISRIVRRQHYRVLHSHTPRAALVGGLVSFLTGVPLVHHVHSQTSVEVGRRWITRAGLLAERLSLVRAAGLLSVSASLDRYMASHGFARHRRWVVPNGVPCQGPLPPAAEPQEWVVGLLALFRPRKGLEVMLDALALVRREGLKMRLRAVGRFETPGYEAEIRRRTIELGLEEAVDWVGFRRDVSAELRHMQIFVLPSLLSEGMPMSILEAMAAGSVVVGSRVDGISDVVHDGRDGLLVAPGNAAELAARLTDIASGKVDWRALRSEAHRRQADEFSEQSMAAAVAGVYHEVLG